MQFHFLITSIFIIISAAFFYFLVKINLRNLREKYIVQKCKKLQKDFQIYQINGLTEKSINDLECLHRLAYQINHNNGYKCIHNFKTEMNKAETSGSACLECIHNLKGFMSEIEIENTVCYAITKGKYKQKLQAIQLLDFIPVSLKKNTLKKFLQTKSENDLILKYLVALNLAKEGNAQDLLYLEKWLQNNEFPAVHQKYIWATIQKSKFSCSKSLTI